MRMNWVELLCIAGLLGVAGNLTAQTATPAAGPQEPAAVAENTLPDAPQPAQVQEPPAPGSMEKDVQDAKKAGVAPENRPLIAPKYHFYIHQGQTSQPLGPWDKMRFPFMENLDGLTEVTALYSAGVSQWDDSDPKYGTDKGAIGQRLGAALLRQTSQAVFNEGIGAIIFHDDPRYYVMGDGHSVGKRILYAGTRTLSIRSDEGKQKPNAPLWLGYLAAAALTQAYYPSASRGAEVVFKTYGWSLGAAALGYEFHEFLGDALRVVHHRRD